jgi:adenylate cyclase
MAGMAEREPEVPEEQRIRFRIGINLGDVIVEAHDIFGDGVNVAARLEGLAEPGGICVSRVVRDQVRDKVAFAFEDLGEQQVKNIARPVRVYRVRDLVSTSAASPSPPVLTLPDKPSVAVLPFVNMSSDPEQEFLARRHSCDQAVAFLSHWKDPNSPRGPIMIDPETRDIVQNVYIRRVEKQGEVLANIEIATIPMVKDRWKELNPLK